MCLLCIYFGFFIFIFNNDSSGQILPLPQYLSMQSLSPLWNLLYMSLFSPSCQKSQACAISYHIAIVSTLWSSLNLWPPRFWFSAQNSWHSHGTVSGLCVSRFFSYDILHHMNLLCDRLSYLHTKLHVSHSSSWCPSYRQLSMDLAQQPYCITCYKNVTCNSNCILSNMCYDTDVRAVY